MKLYVWRRVLSEYSGGIAFAHANSAEEAKQLLIQQGLPEFYFCGLNIQTEDGLVPPRVYEKAMACFVFGGR
jgi:hypothetical protein